MSIENKNLIIIRSSNARINSLMLALGKASTDIKVIKNPSISLIGPSPDDKDIAVALNSATRQPRSKHARLAKRWFLRSQYAWAYNFLSKQPRSTVICWNGMKGFRYLFMLAAKQLGHETIYLEECPLPNRISVDRQGINFGNSLPRKKDFFLKWAEKNSDLTGKWPSIRDEITPRAPAIGVSSTVADTDLTESKFIFCPLQVPGDSQLTVYGDQCDTVEKTISALHACSEFLPAGFHFRLKEHPSAKKRLTESIKALETDRFRLDNASDTCELIKKAEGVVTVNSSVGLEALFFDRPVAVLGHAFYAIDGIVKKLSSTSDLAEWVDEIAAGRFNSEEKNALLDYLVEVHFPLEADVLSGEFGLSDMSARDTATKGILQGLGHVGATSATI